MKFNNTLITSAILSSIFISTGVSAIDETESLRQRSQDKHHFTSLSIDLSGKSGNSDKEDFSFGIYHSERRDQHFGFVMASRDYAKSNDVKSEDSSFLHARYNYYFSKTEAFEVFAQSNTDDFKSLESRNLVGVAYRKEFSEKTTAGLGIFQEQEEYNVNDQKVEFDQTRLSLYWVTTLPLANGAELSNTLYYQPDVTKFSDFRAYNRLAIKSKLTESLSLKFGLLVEHDSQPVLDVEKTDIKYQAGFSYEF